MRLSVGTLKRLIDTCASHLGPVEESVKEHRRKGSVRHQEETGCSVQGTRWWMHVTSTENVTHDAVQNKGGGEALEAIGLMEGFTGTCIHDDLAASRHDTSCTHGSCHVHHLRERTDQEEQKQHVWAKELARFLIEMKPTVEQAKATGQSGLTEDVRRSLIQRDEDLLCTGDPANPAESLPERPKRGRPTQSKARNLLDRLRNQQGSGVYLFCRF
ncbi:MAG TPA: transposase [Ktedonobacteraceae bacterium]|jgi:hypothetical protein